MPTGTPSTRPTASPAPVARLSTHAVDVVLLGDLARPADSPALLRAIRADAHTHIHPAQPVITLGGDDELSALRAYEAGSDHHLADSTGYVLLRAVLLSVARRVLHDLTSRHLTGRLAAHRHRRADRRDQQSQPIRLSRREFELLTTMAAHPDVCLTQRHRSRS